MEKISVIKDKNLIEIHKYWIVPDEVIFVETESPVLSTLGKGE